MIINKYIYIKKKWTLLEDSKVELTFLVLLLYFTQCRIHEIPILSLWQKRTKYRSVKPIYHEYNKTVDAQSIPANSSMRIFNNGTINYTTIREKLAPGSDLVPNGLEIASRNMNVLGLVVFSIVFGIVLGRVKERGIPVKRFFESLNEIIMEMIGLVMW